MERKRERREEKEENYINLNSKCKTTAVSTVGKDIKERRLAHISERRELGALGGRKKIRVWKKSSIQTPIKQPKTQRRENSNTVKGSR